MTASERTACAEFFARLLMAQGNGAVSDSQSPVCFVFSVLCFLKGAAPTVFQRHSLFCLSFNMVRLLYYIAYKFSVVLTLLEGVIYLILLLT